jgi:uncharacterized protein
MEVVSESALAALQPSWNFTLYFVMVGALLVSLPLYQFVILRRTSALNKSPMKFSCGTIDADLIVGGLLFGAGWGTGGLCPGPAIVSLVHGQMQNVVFVGAMLAGMVGVTAWKRFEVSRRTEWVTFDKGAKVSKNENSQAVGEK